VSSGPTKLRGQYPYIQKMATALNRNGK